MTPAEEQTLLKDMRETREAVLEIKGYCAPCRRTVADHNMILHGPAENGKRPGLRSRVTLAEGRIAEIKKAQSGQVKWMRGQLGAIIAAGIAVATKWFYRG